MYILAFSSVQKYLKHPLDISDWSSRGMLKSETEGPDQSTDSLNFHRNKELPL